MKRILSILNVIAQTHDQRFSPNNNKYKTGARKFFIVSGPPLQYYGFPINILLRSRIFSYLHGKDIVSFERHDPSSVPNALIHRIHPFNLIYI